MILCLLAFALSACQYKDTPEISNKDLAYFIRRLSSDAFGGRESGAVSGHKAGRYLSSYYKHHNFATVLSHRHAHEFSFAAGIEMDMQKNGIAWQVKREKVHKQNKASPNYGKKISGIPLPLSLPASFRGNLVFGGYCLAAKKWNELKSLRVKGKAVVCLRYAPGGYHKENTEYLPHMPFAVKYDKLKRAGAGAIVFLGQQGTKPPPLEGFSFAKQSGPPAIFIEPDSLPERVQQIHVAYAKATVKKNTKKLRKYRGYDLGEVEIQTAFQPRQHKGYNIIAALKELKNQERVLLIGGHYDHLGQGYFSSLDKALGIHNGADDNASGAALIMELARFLQAKLEWRNAHEKQKESKDSHNLISNIIFVHFDAEERGLLGSNAFINSPLFKKIRIMAMLNFDMVGRLRQQLGLYIQGSASADARWKVVLKESFAEAELAKGFPLHFVKGGLGPSDHSPFYAQKIPVAFFFTGNHSEYHRRSDTFPLINIAGVNSLTHMSVLLIQKLQYLKKPLQYRFTREKATRKDFGFH